MRFLKAIDAEKFADGLRQALTDDEISMAFWLSTGLPPQLRLKDLRAKDRGELCLGLKLLGDSEKVVIHGLVKVWHLLHTVI